MIRQLTDNVFVQESGWQLSRRTENITVSQSKRNIALEHIVNFFSVDNRLPRVQKLTADSMIRAAGASPKVRLRAVLDAEDRRLLVKGIRESPKFLNRTICDIRKFAIPRRFPLLFDILDAGSEAFRDDSNIIYTNSDICVVPYFYDAVTDLLTSGCDCLIINRRTIGPIDDFLELSYLGYLDIGTTHPGCNCFVFPSRWLSTFVRSTACVGVGFVMRSLLYNLVSKANRMLILRDAHLTYHFGDDRPWTDSSFEEYTAHNVTQAKAIGHCWAKDPVIRVKLEEFFETHGEHYPDGNKVTIESLAA
jgi:hypothetical protein